MLGQPVQRLPQLLVMESQEVILGHSILQFGASTDVIEVSPGKLADGLQCGIDVSV